MGRCKNNSYRNKLLKKSNGKRKEKHKSIQNDTDLDWLDDWCKELKRVCKEEAHLYIFCSWHNIDVFKQTLGAYFNVKNILVWEKNNHTTSKEYCNWHPTQKPLEILERLIKAYTNPGDIVLDLFTGSGSVLVACDNTGRIFNGCEIDTEYYEMSKARYTLLTGKDFNNNLI